MLYKLGGLCSKGDAGRVPVAFSHDGRRHWGWGRVSRGRVWFLDVEVVEDFGVLTRGRGVTGVTAGVKEWLGSE